MAHYRMDPHGHLQPETLVDKISTIIIPKYTIQKWSSWSWSSWPMQSDWVRNILLGGCVIFGSYATYQCAISMRQQIHRRQLRKQAETCHTIMDHSLLLLSLCPRFVGGFLSNASITQVERDRSNRSRILVFASGGWSGTPPSFNAIPLYQYPLAPVSSSSSSSVSAAAASFFTSSSSPPIHDPILDARHMWWIGCGFGKGQVINGSLAFMIAMRLLKQQESMRKQSKLRKSKRGSTDSITPSPLLTYEGRRVLNVGFATGTLYANPTYFQQLTNKSSSSSRSSTAAYSSSSSSTLISRMDVLCEIGMLDPSALQSFRARHYYEPQFHEPAFAEFIQFQTQAVRKYYESYGKIPIKGEPQSENQLVNVLWDCQQVPIATSTTVSSTKDHWLFIEVESTIPGHPPERIHIDAINYFMKGLKGGGFMDEIQHHQSNSSSTTTSSSSASASSSTAPSFISRTWSFIHSISSRLLNTFLPILDPPPLPYSVLPHPLCLTNKFLLAAPGFSLHTSVLGAAETIRFLQDSFLINSDPPNSIHTQLRELIETTCNLCGLNCKYINHKIQINRYNTEAEAEAEAEGSNQEAESTNKTKSSKGKTNKAKHKQPHPSDSTSSGFIDATADDSSSTDDDESDGCYPSPNEVDQLD